jgi:hypothetical protein
MAGDVDNLILAELALIEKDVGKARDEIGGDIDSLKTRLTALEESFVQALAQLNELVLTAKAAAAAGENKSSGHLH